MPRAPESLNPISMCMATADDNTYLTQHNNNNVISTRRRKTERFRRVMSLL